MASYLWLFCCIVALLTASAASMESENERRRAVFMMNRQELLVKTDAGHISLLTSPHRDNIFMFMSREHRLQMALFSMEPMSFTCALYLDSHFTGFVEAGSVVVRMVRRNNELAEMRMRRGDVFQVEEGSVFYMANVQQDQPLRLVCAMSLDILDQLIMHERSGSHPSPDFHSQFFFVSGGADTPSLLSGFDPRLLSAAFNVPREKIEEFLSHRTGGPIMHMSAAHAKALQSAEEDMGDCSERCFRMFEKAPDFRNDYGWSLAVDGHDHSFLHRSRIGMFYINLTAGSMLAPHYNSRASEYALVTKGEGRIAIAYPNGTCAMDVLVKKGDGFWIPRYHPVCQMACNGGDFEFVGFTTSAESNNPRFLAGTNSVLRTIGDAHPQTLAASIGVGVETLRNVVHSQRESVILPPYHHREPQDSLFSVA